MPGDFVHQVVLGGSGGSGVLRGNVPRLSSFCAAQMLSLVQITGASSLRFRVPLFRSFLWQLMFFDNIYASLINERCYLARVALKNTQMTSKTFAECSSQQVTTIHDTHKQQRV